ncbi:MAG: hypothetical protein IH900_03325 [Proteobacteria bacterium]|nr:hypothetical protein [Pseudomonadota bacterium]
MEQLFRNRQDIPCQKTLDTRILDIFEELSPSEQRLADVVLEHQRDLASYSATELADLASVS